MTPGDCTRGEIGGLRTGGGECRVVRDGKLTWKGGGEGSLDFKTLNF